VRMVQLLRANTDCDVRQADIKNCGNKGVHFWFIHGK